MPGEENHNAMIDKWREWYRAEKARSDEYLRDLECEQSRRTEAEKEVERLANKAAVAFSAGRGSMLSTVAKQASVNEQLTADMERRKADLKLTEETLVSMSDQYTAERLAKEAAERQLAIAVEFVGAMKRGVMSNWGRDHGVGSFYDVLGDWVVYQIACAARCLEMIEEVGK
jgi:hypothetical protein